MASPVVRDQASGGPRERGNIELTARTVPCQGRCQRQIHGHNAPTYPQEGRHSLTPCSTGCDSGYMTTTISQRELRNASGDIMRRLEAGETFIVTRAGKPVGELGPVRRQPFVNGGLVAEIFRDAPGIDANRLRRDLDSLADPGSDPRV